MNIIEIILKELRVKYSKSFIEENFLNAPDSDNMLGIQRVLSRYNIETVGVRFQNKEEAGLTFPCVLHWDQYNVVCIDIVEDKIKFYFDGQCITEDIRVFNERWTGNALLVANSEKAKEPSYIKNMIIDLYNYFVFSFLFVLILCIGFLPLVRIGLVNPKSINMIFDLLGFIVCVLLFQKQINKGNTLTDKVCSLLQKGGCDSVLETDVAKFLGIISWAEIGLAYFTSRIVFGSLYDNSISLLQMIGWLAMPYGVWSIWFQVNSKRWCILCCMVQAIVWISGMYNAFESHTFMILIEDAAIYVVCGITTFIVIHTLSKLHSTSKQYNSVNKSFIELKMDKAIFKTALSKSREIIVDKAVSSVFYGNKSASVTLTVLTNPHCEPCARMHKRLMFIIKNNPNIKIQYIYSSFNKDVESSSLFCIAVYQQKTFEEALKILEKWYLYGRFQRQIFMRKYDVDIHDAKVIEEYLKHKSWRKNSKVNSTPTIIYNGHELPKLYGVEDFIYLDIESKETSF